MKKIKISDVAIWGGFLLVLLGIVFDVVLLFLLGFGVWSLGTLVDIYSDMWRQTKDVGDSDSDYDENVGM